MMGHMTLTGFEWGISAASILTTIAAVLLIHAVRHRELGLGLIRFSGQLRGFGRIRAISEVCFADLLLKKLDRGQTIQT